MNVDDGHTACQVIWTLLSLHPSHTTLLHKVCILEVNHMKFMCHWSFSW